MKKSIKALSLATLALLGTLGTQSSTVADPYYWVTHSSNSGFVAFAGSSTDFTDGGSFASGYVAKFASDLSSVIEESTQYTSHSYVQGVRLYASTTDKVASLGTTGTLTFDLASYIPSSASVEYYGYSDGSLFISIDNLSDFDGFSLQSGSGSLCADSDLDMFKKIQSGDAYLYFDIYYYADDEVMENGDSRDVYVDCDSAPSLDDILGDVTCVDLKGNIVTPTVSDDGGYDASTLGVYNVVLTATDTYGQTSTFTLKVHVVDVKDPAVALATGKTLTFNYGTTLKISDLKGYFVATDNGTSHGGTVSVTSFTLDSLALTADKTFTTTDVGTHTLAVTATDSSGNTGVKSFSLTVKDNVAPVVSRVDGGSGTIQIGLSRLLDLDDEVVLSMFTATDAVDGDVSSSLYIDGTTLPTKVGTYSLKISAKDKSGNIGSLTVSVTINADLPPVLILGDTLIYASGEDPLTDAQVKTAVKAAIGGAFTGSTASLLDPLKGQLMAKVNAGVSAQAKEAADLVGDVTVTDISVDDSEYLANSTINGEYPVSYVATLEDASGNTAVTQGTITFKVTDGTDADEDDTSDLSFWDKVVQFFQKIANWFKGVFEHGDFDEFVDDDQYGSDYPDD